MACNHLGYNLKITDMQAACALAQWDRLKEFIAKRRASFTYLGARLQSYVEFLHLPEVIPHAEPSWFGFPLVVKESRGVKRTDLINFLDQSKLGTRLLFAGNLTKQPYMTGRNFRAGGSLANTEVVINRTFWLGVFPILDDEELDYIADKLAEFFGMNF
jgi:CDP-6-deoxy-D-xylo-4-hexulose-3-dehydrase